MEGFDNFVTAQVVRFTVCCLMFFERDDKFNQVSVAMLKSKPAQIPQQRYEEVPEEAAETPISFASLTHLTNPDNLRMAIVYSEILGKPLALRDM